jgi:type I restriction enzyme S subunit
MATWEVKKFEDVLSVLRNGVNCKQNKKGGGNKISRIESISNADFDIEKVGYAELSKSDKDKYKLNRGDILFSHINSPIHVGKTALFNSEDEVYHETFYFLVIELGTSQNKSFNV